MTVWFYGDENPDPSTLIYQETGVADPSTLNYSWGAVRIGQQGGLVQQINAIESLSNVTVLCTDKTGTLTANKIQYHDVYPVGVEKSELEQLLADFAASAGSTNKTSEAIIEGLPRAPDWSG